MLQTFNKFFYTIFFIISFFHHNLQSNQIGDKYIFSFNIDSERLNKIMKVSRDKYGKLDTIFSPFGDKYFANQEEERSFYNDFKFFKKDKSLEIVVKLENFSWDSLRIKDFDFNQNYNIEHMGQIYDLRRAYNDISNRKYKTVHTLNLPNIINPRDDFNYIVQRELNFRPTSKWAYNIRNNDTLIRTRNFPRDLTYDKIELEFFNFQDFDYFQEIFRRSTMKFKKKSVSFLSPIYGYQVVMFDYLPSYYEINDSYINFSFIIPNSFTNKYYLDEIVISSPKENFLTSKNDKIISKKELLLNEILLKSKESSKSNVIWYTKDNDDAIIDLGFLSNYEKVLYEKDKIEISSLKINSSSKFEFDHQLGYSYKDWSAYFNSTNMENRLIEINKIIKENFYDNFQYKDKCFYKNNYKISNKPPFNFTIDASVINCNDNIKKIDSGNFELNSLFLIEDHQVKKFEDQKNNNNQILKSTKSYNMLFIDIFVMLICIIFFKYTPIILEIFNKNKSINRIILIFLPITLLSLVNLKFIFIFLIFLYVGYARYFYLK